MAELSGDAPVDETGQIGHETEQLREGIHTQAEVNHRQKRQARVDWTWRTSTVSMAVSRYFLCSFMQVDPRYYREDPRYNSHHAHWHSVSGAILKVWYV